MQFLTNFSFDLIDDESASRTEVQVEPIEEAPLKRTSNHSQVENNHSSLESNHPPLESNHSLVEPVIKKLILPSSPAPTNHIVLSSPRASANENVQSEDSHEAKKPSTVANVKPSLESTPQRPCMK